jgi:hypothetical protein
MSSQRRELEIDTISNLSLALLAAFVCTPAFGETTLNVASGSMTVSADVGGGGYV